MKPKQIAVNAENLILSYEHVWQALCDAAHSASDIEQDLLKFSFGSKKAPDIAVLNKVLPLKESIRQAIQIILESRKMASDKLNESPVIILREAESPYVRFDFKKHVKDCDCQFSDVEIEELGTSMTCNDGTLYCAKCNKNWKTIQLDMDKEKGG
jgi:hypothetical protein